MRTLDEIGKDCITKRNNLSKARQALDKFHWESVPKEATTAYNKIKQEFDDVHDELHEYYEANGTYK